MEFVHRIGPTKPVDVADLLLRLNQARDFYLHSSRAILDKDVRAAFGSCAEAHAALLDELRDASGLAPSAPPAGASPFAIVERNFEGGAPQRAGTALNILEKDIVRRMERLFRDYPDMSVRRALKRHVLAIQRCEEMMHRLSQRHAA